MFSQDMRYEVEWEDRFGGIHTLVIFERSASRAEDKAEKRLRRNPDFVRIDHVELED